MKKYTILISVLLNIILLGYILFISNVSDNDNTNIIFEESNEKEKKITEFKDDNVVSLDNKNRIIISTSFLDYNYDNFIFLNDIFSNSLGGRNIYFLDNYNFYIFSFIEILYDIHKKNNFTISGTCEDSIYLFLDEIITKKDKEVLISDNLGKLAFLFDKSGKLIYNNFKFLYLSLYLFPEEVDKNLYIDTFNSLNCDDLIKDDLYLKDCNGIKTFFIDSLSDNIFLKEDIGTNIYYNYINLLNGFIDKKTFANNICKK